MNCDILSTAGTGYTCEKVKIAAMSDSCQSPATVQVEEMNEEMVDPVLLEHLSGGSGDCLGSVEAFFCQACNKRYQQPRVLRCLHVLCTPCLEKIIVDDNIGEQSSAETASEKRCTGPFALACPLCRLAMDPSDNF